ncbi:fructosamine kinase family protein [Georgenia sp. TF02-10]|uniref:fructosamine kinase family protein n=1 Tax=Georgenia sp. TF02-10 TaxID=2917725 RepID=UPI001FA7DE36|nr:fructosamine kinase family protein [Georgenia sp. TF02-10]UNX54716.1 fructosamine kinase family protein [Georgenia sp. TF02-10]
MSTFRKQGSAATVGFEAAGLRWLAAAPDGAAVVEVVDAGEWWLETRRIAEGRPDADAAAAFGRALARTHAAGAPHLGCPPAGWDQDGFMGRAPLPLHPTPGPSSWGEFYAADRLLPYLPAAVDNGAIDAAGLQTVERLAARLARGELDHDQPAAVTGAAARLHGDLWAGNVLWAADGGQGRSAVAGTLIDPAAHGGHAESDLAQLGVFGAPHLDRIVAGYQEISPLAPGWRERVGLHQLHMLLVHAALFGGSYGVQSVATAARYV